MSDYRPTVRRTGGKNQQTGTGVTFSAGNRVASRTPASGARKSASAASKQTAARRAPASASGARKAPSGTAREYASGTRKVGAASGARRPAANVTAKRPSTKGPSWLRKRVGNFDVETLLAFALIAVVLAAVVFVGIKVVGGIVDKNTTKVTYDKASIEPTSQQVASNRPEGSPVQSSAGNPFSSAVTPDTGTDNGGGTNSDGGADQPVATPVVTDTGSTNSGAAYSGGLRSCTIRTVGDFVMDVELLDAGKAYAKSVGSQYEYDFSGMLSIIAEDMGKADLTVANVDGSMGGKSHYKYGYSGYPQFNTPEMLILNLKAVGVDMLTLANNHMLDGWFEGLKDEVTNVEKAGLYHVGANRSQAERDTPVIVTVNNIKIGFLNYTESLNSMESRGVDKDALVYGANWTKNSSVADDAKKLRDAGADVIVCYMHWGEEYKTTPNKNQTDMAQKLVKAGVDIIVGGHPHVVQHAEWLHGTNQFGEKQDTFCVYSLGNFLSKHTIKNTDGGIIFQFTIQEKGDGSFEITAPSYMTTYVWKSGDDIFGRGFVVVPCARYINNKTRPQGMSASEYQAMVDSHNNQVAIMNEGVGTQIMY